MDMNTVPFDASELSSRKLWQMIDAATQLEVSEQQLREVIAELSKRRQHLHKLQQIAGLEGSKAGT